MKLPSPARGSDLDKLIHSYSSMFLQVMLAYSVVRYVKITQASAPSRPPRSHSRSALLSPRSQTRAFSTAC